MLGLGRSVVLGLIDAGVVTPARGPRNEHRFSFQDVVLLRTAYELREAQIPARRLLRSLRRLKDRLPGQMPLAGLRIRAVGNDVVVREADAQWEAGSGQLLLDLEVAAGAAGSVSFLRRPEAGAATAAVALGEAAGAHGAAAWFERARALEAADPAGAEAAYRQALGCAPAHEHAYLNLGAMLCDAGRCADAAALYDDAVGHCPGSALLHYNRAIALEDLLRDDDALAAYRRSLELAPDLADAHFNAARLHERRGDAQAALRHYNAYRRLQAGRR